MHSFSNSMRTNQKGVAVIEALIAILIFSVGVLGIIGMQANMIKNTSNSEFRAEATYVSQKLIGAMWADSVPIANLDKFTGTSTFPVTLPNTDKISTFLPAGQVTISKIAITTNTAGITKGGIFSITVGWTAPGEIPAADNTTAPCFMTVAHCSSTTVTISES